MQLIEVQDLKMGVGGSGRVEVNLIWVLTLWSACQLFLSKTDAILAILLFSLKTSELEHNAVCRVEVQWSVKAEDGDVLI